MLEITGDDIALLSDEDLRAVVARLCEADLRGRGHSASYVTWGGNQTAADGGIDVRVALPAGTVTDGFVPRADTGFQVKRQDMPRAAIINEICPEGVIRPSIVQLAEEGGAYIIVSSDGSTADSALQSRRDAMKDAVAGVQNAAGIALDFYDRTRVATWVRSHEGLIPWVRTLVGRAIPGWQSYGPWAPASGAAEYLLDDKLRIHPAKKETENGLSALDGIKQLRDELREPRHVVRLVGLSGVGKTRLVQALFDDGVGTNSLDPALAIYTNTADTPDPQPIGLASNLIASGTRAILVIDNCPSDLHGRLSELCRQGKSKVSVITVEYDIREDAPEGTEVFSLQPSSSDLIEKLLSKRFPDLSQVDTRTIAEFSGGNARIAIALAATIGRQETVAGLTDEQLFLRLFWQRHAPDESLYLCAQACSLVYSFQGEDVSDTDHAELHRLGKLIGRTPQEVYRSVAELQRRDLVQQRGVWRAVLPHAIANRLAAVALQNIPYATIESQLVGDRLLRSFSRRLGYLHASNEAVGIVKKWLGAGGLLEDIAGLDDLGRAIFENVAPVAPEAVVAALERTIVGPDKDAAKNCKEYLDLLRSLAYDAALFEQCTKLMATILVANDVDERAHGTQLFTSLFHLCLSGTQARIEQRLKVIEPLLASSEKTRRALGVAALEGVLEAWHFQSLATFEFGARPRDFGYWPRSADEVKHWFRLTLDLVGRVACSQAPAALDARVAFAERFRGLWHSAGIPDEITRACEAIRKYCFWPEGWLAVRHTLEFDGKGMTPERLAQLKTIEAALRPMDVLQRVRAVVFSTRLQGVDLEDYDEYDTTGDISARMARTEVLARDLGKTVAGDEAVLQELLPELVKAEGRLISFGQGLYDGAPDPRAMWDRLVSALAITEEGARRLQVLLGFLHAVHATNPPLAAVLLDAAVADATLGAWYPYLQVAFDIGAQDVARLKRSLVLGKAPAWVYKNLASGRATDPIPAGDLRDLVLAIAARLDGYDVAVEILHMRLHSEQEHKGPIPPALIDAGCALLQGYVFAKKYDRADYRLGAMTKSCLVGAQGAAVTIELLRKLKAAIAKHDTTAFAHDDLVVGLFTAQPTAALDGLCGGDAKELERGIRILRHIDDRKQPLAVVPEEDLLAWCEQEPQTRFPAIASVIAVFQQPNETSPPQWTAIALRFLERAPDPSAILSEFVAQFNPGGWSGSLAAILSSNAALLDQLDAYPQLSAAIALEKERLQRWIDEQQRRENAMDRQRDERFE
jgi:hypothetical protein